MAKRAQGRWGRDGVAAITVLACLLMLGAGSARATLAWSGPVGRDTGGTGSGIVAVACPSAAVCVALDQSGGEVTFNAAAPVESAPVSIDSVPPTGLVCPTTLLCVAVDGNGNAITFNPTTPSGASTHAIDPGRSLTGLACIPGGSCVAVDSVGYAVTFAPASGTVQTTSPIDLGLKLLGVSCPAAGTCVAIDSTQNEITFTPASGAPRITQIDQRAATLSAITCSTDTACLAFDNIGQQISFNPQSATASLSSTALDGPGHGIVAVTCPGVGACEALDSAGNAVTFSPGQKGAGILIPIDAKNDLTAVACPAQCVAGDGHGHVTTFNPSGGTVATMLIDAQAAYSVVACPGTRQCTAVDNYGDEVSFDPLGAAPATAVSVDPNANITTGIACPSFNQCTSVDDLGQAVTFNPHAAAAATVTGIVTNHPLDAVACPTITQCTVVDDDRYEATFNPEKPVSGNFVNLGTPAGTSITGVACPLATQCTALDGAGDAVSFNPQAPGRPVPVSVLPGPGVAIACPSADVCVAVDAFGDRATFDPHTPALASVSSVASTQPIALSCPTATLCVTLTSGGQAVEFDPSGAGATVTRAIGDPAQMGGLACPAVTECLAVDFSGTAFVGAQPAGAVPAAAAAPGIAGHPVAGERLSVRAGTWRGTPTSFADQWERCDAAGRACRPIPGATGPSYTPVEADVGHALRVQQTAADPFGVSAPAMSAATRAVAGPHVTISRAAFSQMGRGRPRLVLTIATAGALPSSLTLRLPAGVRVLARRGGLHVATGGSVSVVRGSLVVRLRHTPRSVRVTLGWPTLVVSQALALRVGHHLVHRLSVAISTATGRASRTVAQIQVRS